VISPLEGFKAHVLDPNLELKHQMMAQTAQPRRLNALWLKRQHSLKASPFS